MLNYFIVASICGSIGFVLGAAWCGLGTANKQIDRVIECNSCPVNHIKEEIEGGGN